MKLKEQKINNKQCKLSAKHIKFILKRSQKSQYKYIVAKRSSAGGGGWGWGNRGVVGITMFLDNRKIN